MEIRAISQDKDVPALRALLHAAADYIQLETGSGPTDETVRDFFEEHPPGISVENVLTYGLFENERMLGALTMSFGYPQPTDTYIGLLILDPATRGQGCGPRLLAHASRIARERRATRQLIAVIEANPKGRAFWEREGFVQERIFPAGKDGHIRYRLTRDL